MGLNVWRDRRRLKALLAEAEAQRSILLKDFERQRRHLQDELSSADARARLRAASAFLPVYDQLKLALDAEGASESYRAGVRMTLNELLKTLSGFGISRMEPLGAAFDPRLHEALETVPDQDAARDTVVFVMRDGFYSDGADCVVRHAQVRVAVGGRADSTTETEETENGQDHRD